MTAVLLYAPHVIVKCASPPFQCCSAQTHPKSSLPPFQASRARNGSAIPQRRRSVSYWLRKQKTFHVTVLAVCTKFKFCFFFIFFLEHETQLNAITRTKKQKSLFGVFYFWRYIRSFNCVALAQTCKGTKLSSKVSCNTYSKKNI